MQNKLFLAAFIYHLTWLSRLGWGSRQKDKGMLELSFEKAKEVHAGSDTGYHRQ